MSRTIVLHVRYNFLYISLTSSAKQQREITNSALSEERELRRLIFLKILYPEIRSRAAPAVRLAVKTGLSYRNDTIIVFFFAAYKNKDNAEVALVSRILDVTV